MTHSTEVSILVRCMDVSLAVNRKVCYVGCWWHGGSPRVSYITMVTCEKSVVQFVSTKHRRFSPSTLVSSCSNTGPMRGGPYWTSRENSLCC